MTHVEIGLSVLGAATFIVSSLNFWWSIHVHRLADQARFPHGRVK